MTVSTRLTNVHPREDLVARGEPLQSESKSYIREWRALTASNKVFSPREFLRGRNAVLVHFATLMSARLDLNFPENLLRALKLGGVPLSFSTIQRGDTNPQMEGRGGAEGSVGILVDIGPATLIRSVSSSDSGSSNLGSLGKEPNERNCAEAIDKRLTSNEWHVQDYVPIGIFILPPIWVRKQVEIESEKASTEVKLTLDEAIAPFDKLRIFSSNTQGFIEYDRSGASWFGVAYDQIIPK